VTHLKVDLQEIEVISGRIDLAINSPSRLIFDAEVLDFLSTLSRAILKDSEAKNFPDLISVGFALRPSVITTYSEKSNPAYFRKGRGLVFHVTPSNVPLNFVYSFVFSLLSGNSNIVRLSSKNFPQIDVFVEILHRVLEDEKFIWIRNSTCFVRYSHQKKLTDYFSNLCDARVVWGGDKTIREIKQSELSLRSIDLSFPDRYSMSLINARVFNSSDNQVKDNLVRRFFTDAYLFDQQGCSSPKLICWTGEESEIEDAQNIFWEKLGNIAKLRYDLQMKSSVDKFLDICTIAAESDSSLRIRTPHNFLARIEVGLNSELIGSHQGQFGTFIECRIQDLGELESLITDSFQTVTYFGFEIQALRGAIAKLDLRGVDRIVPIGNAFDISVNWDGINFVESLSRIVDFL
jgi:hypothetical protein